MRAALILILLLVIPNLWATFKAARADLLLARKTVLILGIWIIPVIGAVIALREIPSDGYQLVPSPNSPKTVASREPAPSGVEMPGLGPFPIQGHFFEGTGAPILDFQRLDQWSEAAPDEDVARQARQAGRRGWLLHVRDWMGPHAHLAETAESWVVSGFPTGAAQAAAKFIATSRRRIDELLEGLASFPASERSTLIVLDNEDDYYHYVANYYPEEGEFAFSGGMFINAGCPHFVAVFNDLAVLEPVIAHEMTHFALAHLDLPLWLDEGLAVNTELRVSSSYRHHSRTVELIGQHREFWNDTTIQEFWSGQSFHRSDEGCSLSYDLARAIVDLVGRDWENFVRFATTAVREDGGAAAARAALGLDLGELAAAAINAKPKGSWTPRPAVWAGVSVKA